MKAPTATLTILLLLTPARARCAPYGGGSGTAEDPYQIATAAHLILLGESPEDYGKHFILTADIDLDPNLPSRRIFDGAVIAFDPNDEDRAFQGTAFTGVFDGNGHRISHLIIAGVRYLGLFGQIARGAGVKDLGVVDVNVVGSGDAVGGLVGCSNGAVTDCYGSGTVAGAGDVGGLIGINDGAMTRCYRLGTFDVGDGVDGPVGLTPQPVYMDIHHGAGMVDGHHNVGGLVGSNAGAGTIADCRSTGWTAGMSPVGGLVGRNIGTISGSCSEGLNQGGWGVGGLVGVNGGTITDCYSTGFFSQMVVMVWPYCFGGLVGRNSGRITRCYSTGGSWGPVPHGPEEQLERLGGLVGVSGHVVQSFWDVQASGLSESDGGVGLTTAEMQSANTFLTAGWDFVGERANGTEDIWWILEGKDYPRLWWEEQPTRLQSSW
jgi:hypothetical protein